MLSPFDASLVALLPEYAVNYRLARLAMTRTETAYPQTAIS
jgi:hypothetical protein